MGTPCFPEAMQTWPRGFSTGSWAMAGSKLVTVGSQESLIRPTTVMCRTSRQWRLHLFVLIQGVSAIDSSTHHDAGRDLHAAATYSYGLGRPVEARGSPRWQTKSPMKIDRKGPTHLRCGDLVSFLFGVLYDRAKAQHWLAPLQH